MPRPGLPASSVKCPQCGGRDFSTRPGLLDTRGASFFGYEAFNKGATLYICSGCRNIQWFSDP